MLLSDLLPTINQLSHQDKLRLIHLLLMAVAKEEGFSLQELTKNVDSATDLLQQISSTEAIVWSPQTDCESVQALSELLAAAKDASDA